MKKNILYQAIYTILLFSFLSVYGCTNYENHKNQMMVKRLYGKELDFSWPGFQVLSDTVLQSYEINKQITVVTHIYDGLCEDCFSRYLKIADKYVSKFHSDSVQFICIMAPRSVESIQYSLQLSGIGNSNVKVIYDKNNQYLTKNKIDKLDSGDNAFLIDENHKIILVGDPIRSKPLNELYKNTITNMLINNTVNDK